jgi:alpha,alpha-trehalase
MTRGTEPNPVVQVRASRYDAVVFDMDGVMTDTARVHFAAWKRMFDAFLEHRDGETGREGRSFGRSDYLEYVDGKPRDDGVASFLASRGIGLPRGTPGDDPLQESVWGLANRKNLDFEHVLATDGAYAFPSSVRFVRDLQRHGIGTAVISASRNCRRVLDAAGIGDLFPVRVDGIESERLALRGKPAPDVFLEASRRLGAKPSRAAIVEDARSGVEAGRAGHFALVIGVDRIGQKAALLADGADIVVRDLAELRVVPR